MKISLLGDSIRLQYAPVVAQQLGDDFEMFAPNHNCRFAKYTLRGIFDWQNDMSGSRIVHWNNGLWDCCDLFGDGLFSSEEEYVSNMLRIADILLSRHDVLIFATTTPVSIDNKYNKNEDIKRYNDRLVPLLKERGVIINDLYSAVIEDLDKYISDDKIHLSDAGIELCANLTTQCILDAAKLVSENSQKTEVAQSTAEDGAPVIFE